MQETIVAPTNGTVTTSVEPVANIVRVVYRPKGRRNPEQWKAVGEDGRKVDVTPASARLVISLARDSGLYRGLERHPWAVQMPDDGGRKWWAYQLDTNDFGRYLVEVQQ